MTPSPLVSDFRRLGVEAGDTLLVRAAVKSIGSGDANNLIDALLEAVGLQGTIVGLAFSRSQLTRWARNRTFFTLDTPCYTGGFAAALLDRPQSQRSNHPTNSIVAIGARASELTSAHTKANHAFSWMRGFTAFGGKQLLIGCVDSSPGFSTTHFAQEELGLSQRSLLCGFEGTFIDEGRGETWYARSDSPGCSSGFWKMYGHYVRAGILHAGWVGEAYSILASADRCFKIETEQLKADPRYVLCDNTYCLSCATRTYALSRLPRFVVAKVVRRLSMRLAR